MLGHSATYSMDRDLWLNHKVTQSREGEMGGGRGALCHVQARTEYLVFNRHGAEKGKTMTEHEDSICMCFTSIGLREKGLRGAPSPWFSLNLPLPFKKVYT